VHGVTGYAGRWRALAERGLPERSWLAVDLRGHGHSTWEPPWTTEDHVADLLETMDDAGVDRADVIGHSFGGHLATHLASTAPDRVGNVVLVDPATAMDAEDMLEAAAETLADDGWATEEEARAGRLEGRTPQAVPYAEADLAEALEVGEDGRYRMRYNRPTVAAAWAEMARPTASLAGFPRELLLVPAANDGTTQQRVIDSLQRDLGDRLTVRRLDAGHMVYWDAFDELVDVLRPFLLR
jgi:lipase